VNPQERNVAAIVAEAQYSVAECEETLREVVSAGWELLDATVDLDGEAHVSCIVAHGSTWDELGGLALPSFVWLNVGIWPNGTVEIYVGDPGCGNGVPVSEGKVPTPEEAYEVLLAYQRRNEQPTG
jgi:hypothetical protein